MYILECADGSYYTGSTWNLKKRLWEHQNGYGANHTKKHLPVKLVYCEEYDRVENAFRREKQIQGWSRRKKQALIEGNKEKLIEYSKNYTQYGNPALASTSSAGASTKSGAALTSSAGASTKSDAALISSANEVPPTVPVPEPVEGRL
jgi:putative endonuclease